MILAVFLVGCDGGTDGTTMPTSPPTMPPEADQIKKEMTKNLGIKFRDGGISTSRSTKTHRR